MIILSILLVLASFILIALLVYSNVGGGLDESERDVLLRLSRAAASVAETDRSLINEYIIELNHSLALNNNILIIDYGYVSRSGSTYFYIVYLVDGYRIMYMERIG